MAVGEKKKDGPSKLCRLLMSSKDFGAVEHLLKKFAESSTPGTLIACGTPTESSITRYSISQQYLRDRAYGTLHEPVDVKSHGSIKSRLFLDGVIHSPQAYLLVAQGIRDTVAKYYERKGKTLAVSEGGKLHEWGFHYYPQQEKEIDFIRDNWQINTRAHIIRMCIRIQATLSGYTPPDNDWD